MTTIHGSGDTLAAVLAALKHAGIEVVDATTMGEEGRTFAVSKLPHTTAAEQRDVEVHVGPPMPGPLSQHGGALPPTTPTDTSGCCYQRVGGCENHRRTPPTPAAMLVEAHLLLARTERLVHDAGSLSIAAGIGAARIALKREAEAREGGCIRCGEPRSKDPRHSTWAGCVKCVLEFMDTADDYPGGFGAWVAAEKAREGQGC